MKVLTLVLLTLLLLLVILSLVAFPVMFLINLIVTVPITYGKAWVASLCLALIVWAFK